MATGAVKRKMAALGDRADILFRVEFANGSHYQNGAGTPAFTVVIRKRAAEFRTALFGHMGFIESFFDGDIDIEGDLGAAFRVGMEGGFAHHSNPLNVIRNYWHELRYSNRTIAQARKNASLHYGLGTEFYRYWLDLPSMMYTCAVAFGNLNADIFAQVVGLQIGGFCFHKNR